MYDKNANTFTGMVQSCWAIQNRSLWYVSDDDDDARPHGTDAIQNCKILKKNYILCCNKNKTKYISIDEK